MGSICTRAWRSADAIRRGTGTANTGSGVVVYGFDAEGRLRREKMLTIPLQQLAAGRKTMLIGGSEGDKGVPFPAAIAVVGGAGRGEAAGCGQSFGRCAADGCGDGSGDEAVRSVGERCGAFDVSGGAGGCRRMGRAAFVALWNASEVVELDLKKGTVGRKLALLKPESPMAPGTHPCALEISPDGKTLYVALANRDAVAAVDVGAGAVLGEGILRYAAAGAELLWRGAGGAGADRRMGRGCMWRIWVRMRLR